MSLVVNLAVLAEGAATDARGLITLIAANPQSLVSDQLPAQFAPVFLVVIEEANADAPRIIELGQPVSFRVQITGPDGNVVFFSQFQQQVPPPQHPSLPPRLQLLVQVPFSAPKGGEYVTSARIAVTCPDGHEEAVEASRKVLVIDTASLKGEAR
jgi:hypothetical protein